MPGLKSRLGRNNRACDLDLIPRSDIDRDQVIPTAENNRLSKRESVRIWAERVQEY